MAQRPITLDEALNLEMASTECPFCARKGESSEMKSTGPEPGGGGPIEFATYECETCGGEVEVEFPVVSVSGKAPGGRWYRWMFYKKCVSQRRAIR